MSRRAAVHALALVVTAACNLRCRYCYQNLHRARHLSWETARRALDLLLASPRSHLRLTFVGGEPLMRWPLVRRAVEHVEATRRRDLVVLYEIVTNGLLLDDEIARFLEGHRFEVELSFDGVPAAQGLRGRGTFEQLDRRLEALARVTPALFADLLTIVVTVVPATVAALGDSVEYFLARGVSDVALSPAFGVAGWAPERIEEMDEAFGRAYRLSLSHFERTGRVPVQLFRKDRQDQVRTPSNEPLCAAGSGALMTVDVDGSLYGCAVSATSYQRYTSDFAKSCLGALRIGHLDDPQLSSLVERYVREFPAQPAFNGRLRKYSSYGRCASCPDVGRCSICPGAIALLPGNDDPDRIPDFHCAFNRVALRYRDRFPVQPPVQARTD